MASQHVNGRKNSSRREICRGIRNSERNTTQPFLVSALLDDIKKGCAEESYLSFVLNYKGKLYTEIFLKRLILGRVTVFEKNLQSS